jgi:Ca2+-binding RTX toxin-like protein
MFGGEGDDVLSGRSGNDHLDGGPGSDAANGGDGGFDVVRGRAGDDWLYGEYGGGFFRGDSGDDSIQLLGSGYALGEGGTGDDTLRARAWQERLNQSFDLVGGRGADIFNFEAHADGVFAQAHVRDFRPGEDKLSTYSWKDTPDAPVGVAIDAANLFHEHLDTNDDLVLDGTDPASGFASSFALGSGEHGVGMWLGDDAPVMHLPEDVGALSAADFGL